ncbi:MAG: RNA-binding protein [Lachnospiraceae bacterium]|nr:RNA-binding protein [Lachnospiraceae bacterium]
MINLGEYQELRIVKKTDHGVYLSEIDGGVEKVLLPKNQVEDSFKMGDIIKVFIYKDSMDRIIATTSEPFVTLGELASLRVTQVNSVGAFLDWGLVKDLLLPYKEQTYPVKVDDKVLVSVYIDKSNRLCATMKVYDYLNTNSPYNKNDTVTATVISYNENYGVFVAVDNLYNGLIPNNEYQTIPKLGSTITAFVTEVRPDGKLNLTQKKKVTEQIADDATIILEKLKVAGGFLPYNDKSAPDAIKKEFNLSKNSFKKAIGNLYKNKTITIEPDGIHLCK